jgi:hypothetical protein
VRDDARRGASRRKEIEMTTFQIKSLMFVAAVACLPVACGTSSSTGPDLSAIEAAATASALRSEPGPGPQAPGSPSVLRPVVVIVPETPPTDPYPVPSPGVPSNIPSESPSPRPVPSPEPTNDVHVPQPTNDVIVPAPAPDGGIPSNIPVPAPGGPSSIPSPAPPSAPPTTTVPPTEKPDQEVPPPSGCLAASIQIVVVKGFAEPYSVALEAVLVDRDGALIEDSSCERLAWTVFGSGVSLSSRAVITYMDRSNSRLVVLSGAAGTYTVGVSTPGSEASSRMQIVL